MMAKGCVNFCALLFFAGIGIGKQCDQHRPSLVDLEAIEIDYILSHYSTMQKGALDEEPPFLLLRQAAFTDAYGIG